MSTIQKYVPFFTSALLMYLLLLIIYPHYQYYIDPDGTAYLAISQRYANGEYQKAINGLWSPLGCWLTALFIKAGVAAIPASWLVNSLAAGGFLFISQSFYVKFNIAKKVQWSLNIMFALYLCYAIFWQSFDDLWECFLLLSTFRIMLADRFKTAPVLWIACGLVGAIAFFAKAYSFPFFILNVVCCTYFIARDDKAQWLKISFVAIGVMLVCSLPWLYALHYKYGRWLTSTAGPLNMTWFLVGHPYRKEGIDLLLPPIYSDSPSYWEDPWFVNGIMPHFYDSFRLAGLQVLRLGLNAYKLIRSMLQISVFFPVISVIALLYLRPGKIRNLFTGHQKFVVISFLLFPLGYIPVDFQARFLWYMLPLAMIIWTVFMQSLPAKKWHGLFFILFPLSFLINPAFNMKTMYNEGINDHTTGAQLKKLGIHGTFTSMSKPGIESQRIQRLAYFSGNQLYSLSRPQFTQQDILREMARYHVKYFFVYSGSEELTGEQASAFPEITNGNIPGLKVFLVNP